MYFTLKRFSLLVVALTSLFTILSAQAWHQQLPKPRSLAYRIEFSGVTRLRVGGNLVVKVETSRRYRRMSYILQSHNPQWVQAKVRHHTLYLRRLYAAVSNRKPSVVIVQLPLLTHLSVYGIARVYGHNIRSQQLVIRVNDYARVHFSGELNVSKIVNNDHARVRLAWVKGPHLSVIGSQRSRTILAGKVNKFTVRLNNRAQLQATYLRANRVLISTHNHAIAKVLPIKHLYAFAHNHSNIYYYKYPGARNLLTKQHGNVLQLGWHR